MGWGPPTGPAARRNHNRGGDSIDRTRNTLYTTARLLGDVQAVRRGTVGRRMLRRALGKGVGRGFGRMGF